MDEPSRHGTIAASLSAVRQRLARSLERAGRSRADVRLVAVSKTRPPEDIRAAVGAGQLDFGENRVQEALEKIGLTADMPISWHLVGHLQSNKARKAAAAFAWIHSIDGVDLLRRVDEAAADAGRSPVVLVQVDLAGEPTKHGVAADACLPIFEAGAACRAASVGGLMVLPPFTEDPEEARPYFRRLRELRDALAGRGVPAAMLRELSMGMSHDFEVAVEEGATVVRVGTAIFGERA
ncbi:MAG TPA: YggS family pyridoxal phosphate-dependent enzyme [Vicinamibacterales bacterium]|nr:YggS family pyridoxal phosphate-dependent enzyme [Vicinamibacterales bacterium]HOG28789.1 YggS family pyridoxal phosphate-dependent enzyme [Vicinamibacterales bacterium]HOQ61059.1 YggS family pyridoxal phosphate-dependent enzyme [Vicinamibacterales bacterium]HPK72439.1 YggS family pyridoxal phosphate-dependent enzyme [Vicinamibacterales bacterium]HPW20229.1 YggS family pyridoxal phosphate-dependent enzyme [Vicinamibacterales bacterium]